ncbi:MAG: cobalamin-dependent protein [Candidatus Omnitrophica bacterium]|nr:cobalamin-dependent protein [Candidatus Omnitrophota bacterium]
MKILLVQPPVTIPNTETRRCHPPLGVAYLAAVLKDDFETKALDCIAEGFQCEKALDGSYIRHGLSDDDIKRHISEFSPDVIGVSCLFSSQKKNAYHICAIGKELNKNIITILGGAHPSTEPEDALGNKEVDFVVTGEAELALKELLLALRDKTLFKDVPGIGFKLDGKMTINPRRQFIQELDELPFPYWDIFPLDKYAQINNPHGMPAKLIPFFPVITSRGCPFECVFCSIHNLWGRVYRQRSPENIIEELKYLSGKFGAKEILFEDDNLTLNRERAGKIFKAIIDGRLDIAWSTPNGVAVQTLDTDLLILMKKSGCYAISIGIESGDEYVLHSIVKKPIELSKIKAIIKQAAILGLETTGFFVVGFPGETRQQVKNTFIFARSLGMDNVNFFFATPLPGTRLLQLCRENNLVPEVINYELLESSKPFYGTGPLSKAELELMVRKERLRIYFINLLFHPKKTFSKIFHKLTYDPKYFLRFLSKLFRSKIKE